MKQSQPKVAIVTGGGRGIGAAITKKLMACEYQVVVGQRSTSALGDWCKTDLSQAVECEQLVRYTTEKYGRIDALINNAGIMTEASVTNMTLESWEKSVAVNLTAPFLLIKQAMPNLVAAKGVIVNIGSIEGLGANPLHAAYCATKGGLHALTRAIAVDAGKDGVRCNAVAPGWIDTDLNEAFIQSMPNPFSFREKIGDIHPLKRTGKPEEVAELVYWLVSNESSFITGQVMTIDGGRTAKLSLPN